MSLLIFNQPYAIDFHPTDFWGFKATPYTAKRHIWIWKTLRECKWKIGLPEMTAFKLRQNTYNLRNFHAFESQNYRTKKFGLHSIVYKASQLWKDVPEEVRNSASVLIFKESIKKFPLTSCLCHCCKIDIHHVVYI